MLTENLDFGEEPEAIFFVAELAWLDCGEQVIGQQLNNFLVEVAAHVAGEPAALVGPGLIHLVPAEQTFQTDHAVVHDDEHDLAAVFQSFGDLVADLEHAGVMPVKHASLFRCNSCHNKNLLNIFAYKSVLPLKSRLIVHTSEQYIGVNQ